GRALPAIAESIRDDIMKMPVHRGVMKDSWLLRMFFDESVSAQHMIDRKHTCFFLIGFISLASLQSNTLASLLLLYQLTKSAIQACSTKEVMP
ncbi:hypothetical protein K5D44_24300, partial [Pseudomonas cichorii]